MKKTKLEKGITLIALIITIVVLLILAVVTIGAVRDSSIIAHAQNAAKDYNGAKVDEETAILGYESLIDSNLPGGNSESDESTIKTVAEAQTTGVLSTTSTIEVKDEYGNIIKLPAGFKITTDSNNVTEGIVIEDCTQTPTNGSQFVWIPVGTVYTSTNQASSETINLNRYTFGDDGTPSTYTPFSEEVETSTYENATAKDLNGFILSAKTNGGYYIGRYEAGTETERSSGNDELTQVVVKSNLNAYNWVTQLQASTLSQGMYENNEETNIISDLTNSYAWDTAIVFIQTFSTELDASTYSRKNTGESSDIYCNIYDMSTGVYEYSTETYLGSSSGHCTCRGGFYYCNEQLGIELSDGYTGYRGSGDGAAYLNTAFRVLLYL